MNYLKLLLVLLFIGQLVLSSCNTIIKASGNTMREMRYDRDTITVKENRKVKLTLINEATDQSMYHNIVIVAEDKMEEVAIAGLQRADDGYVAKEHEGVIAYSALAGPGETVEVKFKAPAKGTYKFICTFPGHWQLMNGTLIVK